VQVRTGATDKDAVMAAANTTAPVGADLLVGEGILMQFGGLKAINQVDIRIKRGTIHGLIGPNGSGKKATMNVLTASTSLLLERCTLRRHPGRPHLV
jgi:branched-chain amino acid transport system permease protein